MLSIYEKLECQGYQSRLTENWRNLLKNQISVFVICKTAKLQGGERNIMVHGNLFWNLRITLCTSCRHYGFLLKLIPKIPEIVMLIREQRNSVKDSQF